MRTATASLLLGVLLCAATPTAADNILAGVDIYETLPTSSQIFAGVYEVPLDFFDPGSEPFTGTVFFETAPVLSIPGCSLLPASPYTVIGRAGDAFFPGGETIPIELVQLSLVSVAPITVTYPGGATEMWNVQMTTFPGPLGTMTLQHDAPNGGTFTAQLPVRPRFTFQRVAPPQIREFIPDVGAGDVWNIAPTPWSHLPAAGMVEILGCTTNFFPGVIPFSAHLAAAAAPPASPVMISGPFTSLDCVWPTADPTTARNATWGRIKRLYR